MGWVGGCGVGGGGGERKGKGKDAPDSSEQQFGSHGRSEEEGRATELETMVAKPSYRIQLNLS